SAAGEWVAGVRGGETEEARRGRQREGNEDVPIQPRAGDDRPGAQGGALDAGAVPGPGQPAAGGGRSDHGSVGRQRLRGHRQPARPAALPSGRGHRADLSGAGLGPSGGRRLDVKGRGPTTAEGVAGLGVLVSGADRDEGGEQGPAEVGQVLVAAAGDQVAVDDNGLVVVGGAGGAQVVADAGGGGGVPAAEGAGADEQLRAAADGGDAAVLLPEGGRGVGGLLTEPEPLPGVPPRDGQPGVTGRGGLAEGHVGLDLVAVLAGGGLAAGAGQGDLDTVLSEPIQGVEELEIVESVSDQDQRFHLAHLTRALVGREGWLSTSILRCVWKE